MASEVDICNLALAQLGDSATIASIDPPEGSAQAEHCAKFYPVARDLMLQSHQWNFATKRGVLALLGKAPIGWEFSYAMPNDCLTVLAVQMVDAADNYRQEEYVVETNAQGQQVIYTNVENAIIRYVARIKDTTKFSPLFTTALAWQLSGMLAGPIIKGDAGASQAQRCIQMAGAYLAEAKTADSNQRHLELQANPHWLEGRGASVPKGWAR